MLFRLFHLFHFTVEQNKLLSPDAPALFMQKLIIVINTYYLINNIFTIFSI